MKSVVFLSAVALMLASCTTPDVEPIPGSITYGGQPRTKLTKSPIGSLVHNSFRTVTGVAYETYVIQPDRSLKLIRREIRSDFFDQN
ncbi:hypothetical protein [Pararhizobium sp. PWRC1-1]|uniref:hypothetical protein n=1 Tax=Pararhizobium sp. PWRC1-1 TaxID=2804566 RepID=UPI003CF5510B